MSDPKPSPNRYDVGSVVRVYSGKDGKPEPFRNIDGAPTDPTGLTMWYRLGTGNKTSKVYTSDAEVVRDGTGLYHIDITASDDGNWYYGADATGVVAASYEHYFIANETHG